MIYHYPLIHVLSIVDEQYNILDRNFFLVCLRAKLNSLTVI